MNSIFNHTGTETERPEDVSNVTVVEDAPTPKRRGGFAVMNRDDVRAIASKGGKAAHEQGTAHKWTTEEAREAGRKGGRATHERRGRKTAGQ